METEEELRVELTEIGQEKFRLKYERMARIADQSHHTVKAVKAIFAELDRKAETPEDAAELDRKKADDWSAVAVIALVAAAIIGAVTLLLLLLGFI